MKYSLRLNGMKTFSTWCIVVVGFAVVLAGCSTGGDKKSVTPTAGSQVTVAGEASKPPAKSTGTAATEASKPAELTDENAQIVSDGLCQMLAPDGWVDDGTGRGTTSGGHRFVLFGGRLTSSTSWAAAINVVATPTSGRSIASIDKSDLSIRANFADDRGFEYRERFDSTYCDLTVSSASGPISQDERAYWDAIIESIEPVAT